MIIEKIKATIKKYNMLEKGDKVLVGFSGGKDSMTLVHILNSLKKEFNLKIYLAHVNHKFRGKESDADTRFCKNIAERFKLGIVCERIDVPKVVKEKGLSAEEAARQKRYGFFAKVCKKKGIKKIAVGHNKDDQAETVLLRLLRGAGITGLGGMSPVKEMKGITIIRPLIEISRKEIEDFIEANRLGFRHDSSNDKTVFTRNRIRKELIPYLEKNFNPNIKELLFNMAENLREENNFIEGLAKKNFKSTAKVKKRSVYISMKKFKALPEAMKKRVLRSALQSVKGNLRRFTYQHWKEIEKLIEERPVNSIVDLPGGIDVVKNKKGLTIDIQKI